MLRMNHDIHVLLKKQPIVSAVYPSSPTFEVLNSDILKAMEKNPGQAPG